MDVSPNFAPIMFYKMYYFIFLPQLYFCITRQPIIGIEWPYNEAHHGNDLMDGPGRTVKSLVY